MPLPPETSTLPTDVAGLGAAVAALHDGARSHAEEQVDLFAQSPLAGALRPMAERRGPGRPEGAQNRNTSEWTAYIQRHYRSPLLFLADVYNADTAQLAAEIGCTKAEAFALQRACAVDLAPYLHRKQPIAVDAGEGVPMPKIVHVMIDAAQIGQVTGNAQEIEVRPIVVMDEVAAPKSQDASDGGSDD